MSATAPTPGLSPLPVELDHLGEAPINRPPTCRTSTSRPVMERFIDTIDNPGLASRLRDAISRPKGFRRFKTELGRHDDEYTRWHRFRDDARLGRARAWLAEHGYRSAR